MMKMELVYDFDVVKFGVSMDLDDVFFMLSNKLTMPLWLLGRN